VSRPPTSEGVTRASASARHGADDFSRTSAGKTVITVIFIIINIIINIIIIVFIIPPP